MARIDPFGYAAEMDERLRPIERLQCSHEFRNVFDRGRCFRSRHLRVHYLPSGREFSRLGLVVTRKLGNAVARKGVKRHLREVYRRQKALIPWTMDVILLPRGEPRSHGDYLEAFLAFLKEAALCEPTRSPLVGENAS